MEKKSINLGSRNVVIVTGSVGCGKTTFMRDISADNGAFVCVSFSHLASRWRGDMEGCDTVFIDDTELNRSAKRVIAEFATAKEIWVEKKGEAPKMVPTPLLVIATDKPVSQLQNYLGALMSRVVIVPFYSGE